jgi:ADP-ribose pyrophosphatase YjhB (NUDIX family)
LTARWPRDTNCETTPGADGDPAKILSQRLLRGDAPAAGVCRSGVGLTTYFASDPTELRLSVSGVVRRQPGASEILLMQRSDNGHWGLPGGYVEVGESLASALAREVREETGWGVRVGRLAGVYSDPARQVIDYGGGRRVHAVNLCFEALATEPGAPQTPQETLAVAFFAWDALPEPFVPIHRVRIEDAFRGDAAVAVR